MVICLEAGLSLRGAFRRIISELWQVHPLLADEMAIVEREMLLGRTTGEALREFSRRTDLEEMRSLAALMGQTEQFGTGVVKALGIFADTLRQKRMYDAEEIAQKAATKILIPTLLLLFPSLFVVILGPAAIQLSALMKVGK
jgi:tight adherence protein C